MALRTGKLSQTNISMRVLFMAWQTLYHKSAKRGAWKYDKICGMGTKTASELEKTYGAPGRIGFRFGHCGQPVATLAGPYGTAEVALLGGNVLTYKPTGQPPVIYRSPKGDYGRTDSIHCGIPVCWPWFGKSGEPGTKPHGFARICAFDVRSTRYTEEMSEIVLGLKSSEDTRSLWPHDFDLELTVSVSMKLNLKLRTRNTGSEPFLLTEGFHPYFLVGERERVTVRGVDGLSFVDARDMSEGVFAGDFAATEPSDHVVTMPEGRARHEVALLDPVLRRAIAVASTGNRKLVIWNPGPGNSLADQAPDDWRKFLCVEPATLWRDAGFTLAPGEEHVLEAAIQSTLET